MEELAKSRYGIVTPVYKGKKGHPVIFTAKYKSELSELAGDAGAKKIIEAHPEDILEVAVDSESIITDIDNESDYRTQQGDAPSPGHL